MIRARVDLRKVAMSAPLPIMDSARAALIQSVAARPGLPASVTIAMEPSDGVDLSCARGDGLFKLWTPHGPIPMQPPPLRPASAADASAVIAAATRMQDATSTCVQRASANDERELGDGFDSSRDIIGVEAAEGKPTDPYLLRVDLENLKPGAENGNLDVYWLIGTGAKEGKTALPDGVAGTAAQPWNLAVAAYDGSHSTAQDAQGTFFANMVKSVRFDSVAHVVELALDKSLLRQKGWKDGDPLQLQAFTTKDFTNAVTDSLDGPGAKPWNNGGKLSAAADTSKAPWPVAQRSPNWEGESVYFVFTDRFNDGDASNDAGVNKKDLRCYHGGDLRGVIDKLDYIKGLGMSTIWISPPMANQTRHVDPDGSFYEGFHGYWPVDFYRVDPRQGDMATLQELVKKAHGKGLKVLMDLPLNQAAWEHPWTQDPSKYDWFHHNGNITNWEDPVQCENNDILWLPDLAQENPAVAAELIKTAKFWIDQTGIDGFRLDAVKHVNRQFWPQFERAIHAYAGPDFLLLGEDLHGSTDHVGSYQKEGMESLFDFPLYFTIRDTIGRGGSMGQLADRLAEENARYDNASMMSVFLDNHDLNRFMTDAGDDARRKLMLALAFEFTINRIPMVYQGTEQAMSGAQSMDSPDHMDHNREDVQFGKDPELQAYFSKVAALRQATPALREGGYLETWKDNDVFAYERVGREQSALVVLNGSAGNQHREIPANVAGRLKEGMRLRDALSGEEVVVKNGRLSLDLPPRTPRIFLPL